MAAVLAGVLAGALLAACESSSQRTQAPPFAHLKVSPTFHSYHPVSGPDLVSSIVQDDTGQVLIADDKNVFALTRVNAAYAFTVLQPPAASAKNWHPAGLAARSGLLYVANDNGHDVLVVRRAGNSLTLVREILSKSMQLPQNVAVDQDGSIYVADSTGVLLRFNSGGSLMWRTPVDRARGVAISGGSIFATSVGNKTIVKVSTSGAIVKTAGSAGVSVGRYQLPIGLAAAPNGRLLLTDQYNGRVAVLDQNLRVLQQIGANGAGVDAFNLPSATIATGDGYLVADTFKHRLVRTDAKWQMQEQIVLAASAFVPAGRERPLVYGTDARPITYPMLPGVDVAAEVGARAPLSFVGGFNGLDQSGAAKPIHLNVEDYQLNSMGQTWAERVGQYIVIGSPTNNRLEVIDPATGMFSYVEVGGDAWWRAANALLMPGGLRRSLTDVIAPAVTAFAKANQLLSQNVPRRDVLNQVLGASRPRDLARDLTSDAGKVFLASPMKSDDALKYYDAIRPYQEQRIIELLEVKFLASGP